MKKQEDPNKITLTKFTGVIFFIYLFVFVYEICWTKLLYFSL